MDNTRSLTQSMAWLHRWAGLVLGWLLFAIFLTGTLTVFDKEISWWMQPELRDSGATQAQSLETAERWLNSHQPDAELWSVRLPTERNPVLGIAEGKGHHAPVTWLDPLTGETLEPRETRGGGFFFRFHFSLDTGKGLGVWIVGLAAIGMLVALLTSLLIHKRIFKDFFVFRGFKGKRSWLDAHNVTGVLLLPFHFMIAYTGLVIFFMIYMPAALQVLYGDEGFDRMSKEAEARPAVEAEAPAGPLLPLAAFIEPGEDQWGPGMVSRLTLVDRLTEQPVVVMSPGFDTQVALVKGLHAHFSGVTGEPLETPAEYRWLAEGYQVMTGLHFAQFGGYPMRWMYFCCGLIGSAMIATGLVLFSMRERRQLAVGQPLPGFIRLVEALNVALVAGLLLATVSFFWANRLLPVEMTDRSAWELAGFYAPWLLALVHAWLRPWQKAWQEQLGLAAVLCLGLPLLSWLQLGHWPRDGIRLGFEVATVGFGLMLLWGLNMLRSKVVVQASREVQG